MFELLALADRVRNEHGHYLRIFNTPKASIRELNEAGDGLTVARAQLRAAWLQASPEERAEALSKADRGVYVNGAVSSWERLDDLRHLG